MDLGEKFKLIRKQRKLTLAEISKVAGSSSSISDFENGKTLLSIDVLNKLLEYMLVDPNEFYSSTYPTNNDSSIIFEINQICQQGDISLYPRCMEILDVEYKKTNLYAYRILYMNLSILYDYETTDTYNKEFLAETIDYLFSLNIWTTFDISIYGNIVVLLPSNTTYLLTKELLKELPAAPTSSHDRILLDTINNSVFALLEQNDLHSAHTIYLQLEKLALPRTFLMQSLTIKFINCIILYMQGDKEQSLALVKDVLHVIEILLSPEDALDWKASFNELVK